MPDTVIHQRSALHRLPPYLVRLSLSLALLLGVVACSYRVAAPQQLPQGLAIRVVANHSRQVQSQVFLEQQLGIEIERELGWQIHPQAINNLLITINAEHIEEAASNADKISIRWNNKLNAQVTFTSPYLVNGKISKHFSSSASNSSLANENNALNSASEILARDVRSWLDTLTLRQIETAP